MSRVLIRPPLATDRGAFLTAMEASRELLPPVDPDAGDGAGYEAYVQRNEDRRWSAFSPAAATTGDRRLS